MNPFGGAGAAAAALIQARRIMDVAHLDVEIRETERRNHGFDMVCEGGELDLTQYDNLVTVSGDGLIHEVCNGLLLRSDWKEVATRMTIGCIPGGTSNGLVKSILAEQEEDCGVLEATFMIVRGRRMPIDIAKIEGEYQEKPIYSVL